MLLAQFLSSLLPSIPVINSLFSPYYYSKVSFLNLHCGSSDLIYKFGVGKEKKKTNFQI